MRVPGAGYLSCLTQKRARHPFCALPPSLSLQPRHCWNSRLQNETKLTKQNGKYTESEQSLGALGEKTSPGARHVLQTINCAIFCSCFPFFFCFSLYHCQYRATSHVILNALVSSLPHAILSSINLDTCRLLQNSWLRGSLAIMLRSNLHVRVATRFRVKFKETSTSSVYVVKLLHQCLLTLSL